MRFSVGDVTVDIIVDDDDFELPLSTFLPGSDGRSLAEQRGLLEPDFLDLARDVVKFAVQTFALRVDGRTIVIDTCIGERKNRPENSGPESTPQHGFPRTAGEGRHRAGRRRCRVLHSPAYGPCRVEHASRGRPLGTDLSERPLSYRTS